MSTGFALAIKRLRGINVVEISGDLDVAAAPQLGEALSRLRGPISIDCERLLFIDSTGLVALATAYADNPSLTLRHVSRPCRKVLRVAGLEALLALDERTS